MEYKNITESIIKFALYFTGKTKSVDVTITNLLEGHVPYTPSTSPTFSSLTSSSNASSSVLRRRGNAAQRQLSLEERKRELLDNAKR